MVKDDKHLRAICIKVICWLGHSSIQTTLIWLELVTDPSRGLAAVRQPAQGHHIMEGNANYDTD